MTTMGVEWIIACEERKEIFELGKGPWDGLGRIVSEAAVERLKVDGFVCEVANLWFSGEEARNKAPGFMLEYASRFGIAIWGWCKERDWKVKVVNDAIGEFGYEMTTGWMITGTRFENDTFLPVPAPSLVRDNAPAIAHRANTPAINVLSHIGRLREEIGTNSLGRQDTMLARCILELDDRLKRMEKCEAERLQAEVGKLSKAAGCDEPADKCYKLSGPDDPFDVVKGCSADMDLVFRTIKPRPGARGEKPVFDFHAMRPVGTSCSVCGEIQFDSPSGPTCKNGHGGAPPKVE